jgi:peptide/nickel transport system permease protein
VLPNSYVPIVVASTLGVANAMLTEAALSFLGLGIQPPTPSWGNMLNEAQSLQVLVNESWVWIGPGLAIALTVLSINFLGDGLRDALDPHSNG